MTQMRVYYDFTRLVARSGSTTPTGIDRVDLRYGLHFSESKGYKLIGVYQRNGTFFELPAVQVSLLLETLRTRWLAEPGVDRSLSSLRAKALGSGAMATFQSALLDVTLSLRDALKHQTSVDGSLLDTLLAGRSQESCYINTSHHGVGETQAYYVFRVAGRARIVFYLHDLIPCDYPEYVREGDGDRHAERVRAMLAFGDLILTNSAYTRRRLLRFAEQEHLRQPPVHIATIGVEPSFLRKASHYTNGASGEMAYGRYFITIGTIEPRKNHLLLLQLWRQLAEAGQDIGKLVVVGRRGWMNEGVLALLDRNQLIRDRVVELSGISDARMMTLLHGARALLYPSFAEGWGMPLVEAIALRVPVVCSDIEAFRESGQGLVTQIDPLDGPAWVKQIQALHSDESERERLLRRAGAFRFPQWEEHFELLDRALAEIPAVRNSFTKDTRAVRTSFDSVPRAGVSERLGTYVAGRVRVQVRDAGSSSRSLKKLKKLRRDPQRFFDDSSYESLRRVGRLLKRSQRGG